VSKFLPGIAAAGGGALISLLVALAAGVRLPALAVRPAVFAVVFFALGQAGARILAELAGQTGTPGAGDAGAGHSVDVVVGDDPLGRAETAAPNGEQSRTYAAGGSSAEGLDVNSGDSYTGGDTVGAAAFSLTDLALPANGAGDGVVFRPTLGVSGEKTATEVAEEAGGQKVAGAIRTLLSRDT